MPLGSFRAERFRCLARVEIELDAGANLFVGPNASGKTSLLEAAFFLSRGRSFRTRRREALIAHGEDSFLLAGQAGGSTGAMPLSVRACRSGTEWHVGGAIAAGIADLAEQFPAQVIEPEVHKLLEEGPGRRRRFLDWGVFHVEQTFLPTWRRYHQALRQRNAALKQDAGDDELAAWERELAGSGEALAAQRDRYLVRLAHPLERIGLALLDQPIALEHQPGWDRDRGLLATLQSDRRRDRRYRATQLGPHRADAVVRIGAHVAKDRVSRGQQKLVAAALILAQLEIQAQEKPGRSVLLLDDPAAELDADNLVRLMRLVGNVPAQLWMTALRPDVGQFVPNARLFHVEHGEVQEG